MFIGFLLTVCLSSMALASGSTSTSSKLPSQQPQPAGYDREMDVSRENYEAVERTRFHLNVHIPSAPIAGLRIVTYNLHFFRDLYNTASNLKGVIEDIRAIDADILLLQEVVTLEYHSDRPAFDEALDTMGYQYRHFDIIPGFREGNMIASKLPLTKKSSLSLGSNRILVQAEVELGGDQRIITLYCTHWEVKSDEIRMEQSQMLLERIKQNETQFIVGADFNAMYDTKEFQNLLVSGLMGTSFDILGWDRPDYTCWSGNDIDWFLVSNTLRPHVIGSYAYHSVNSDHLAIIMDLLDL